MDGVSALAGVATVGVQLSKLLYDLYSTVRTSRHEIEDVANSVSLLAMVLEELDGVLCDDQLEYRPQLRDAAHSISLRCANIFKDIRKHTGTNRELKGQKFYEKVAWYFRRERVKLLRSSLESLKSTLNVLLHVVQLAKNTRGIAESPGAKAVGHSYVRRERRGLVYLVIDNRHTVERLTQQEQHKGKELIENERPLTFADIFPTAPTGRRRGQSPDRKFVVAFRDPAHQNNNDYQLSQEPEIDFLQASPSTPQGDQFLVLSPSREGKRPLDFPTDSEVESIDQSTSSRSNSKPKMKERMIEEQSTSRLILDTIPHEIADDALKLAQNMSRSTLLEAKAEETIDLLMRHWTYMDPEYFSEDDRSSIPPTEPANQMHQYKSVQRSYQRESLDPVESFLHSCDGPRRQRSGQSDTMGPSERLYKSQRGGNFDASHPLRAGRTLNAEERSDVPSPTPRSINGGPESKVGTLSHTLETQDFHSTKEPSTPAPPYPSSHPEQHPFCSPSSSSEPKSYNTGKSPCQPTDTRISDVKVAETTTFIDNAIGLFETKLLELMKQKPLPNINTDAQSLSHSSERNESLQQSVGIIEPDAEPVILKDCLGREFLFPIQKCRSWPSMENLIKRSFSHVETVDAARKIFTGRYDILSPTGAIILPDIWDSVIQPGWVVELRFWDLPPITTTMMVGETGTTKKDVEIIGGVVVDVDEDKPVVVGSGAEATTTGLRQSYVREASSGVQLAAQKRRGSFRSWIAGRKSTPSAAIG